MYAQLCLSSKIHVNPDEIYILSCLMLYISLLANFPMSYMHQCVHSGYAFTIVNMSILGLTIFMHEINLSKLIFLIYTE